MLKTHPLLYLFITTLTTWKWILWHHLSYTNRYIDNGKPQKKIFFSGPTTKRGDMDMDMSISSDSPLGGG